MSSPIAPYPDCESLRLARRAGRLWTNMIQAQRDYFGAHGFERIDRPGTFHGTWNDGPEP